MGWNALGNHSNPLTSQVIIPVSRKFESSKRGVNTHKTSSDFLVCPNLDQVWIAREPLSLYGSLYEGNIFPDPVVDDCFDIYTFFCCHFL
jgi:hypothetical protein